MTRNMLPVPVSTRAHLWYRPEHCDLDGNGRVSIAYDLSGNARHSEVVASSNRPNVIQSNRFPGRKAWYFGGTQWIKAPAFQLAQPFSLIAVIAFDPPGNQLQFVEAGATSGFPFAYATAGTTLGMGDPTGFTTPFNYASTSTAVLVFTFDTASSSIRANGTTLATGSVSGTSASQLFLGIRFTLLNGIVGEVLDFLVVPSSSVSSVETRYLRYLYGLT